MCLVERADIGGFILEGLKRASSTTLTCTNKEKDLVAGHARLFLYRYG